MATLKPLLAKILIQVGADEPKEIGTIEIPINVSIPGKSNPGASFNIQTAAQVNPERIAEDIRKRLSYYQGS